MIAVDSSALMAIAMGEPDGARCKRVMDAEPHVLISAANEVAKAHDCPLLYIGDDFSHTDLVSAL